MILSQLGTRHSYSRTRRTAELLLCCHCRYKCRIRFRIPDWLLVSLGRRGSDYTLCPGLCYSPARIASPRPSHRLRSCISCLQASTCSWNFGICPCRLQAMVLSSQGKLGHVHTKPCSRRQDRVCSLPSSHLGMACCSSSTHRRGIHRAQGNTNTNTGNYWRSLFSCSTYSLGDRLTAMKKLREGMRLRARCIACSSSFLISFQLF